METIIGTSPGPAIDLLKKGELVAIPTETVYGLAANALDDAAVLKIFHVKNRPAFDPLIVHLRNFSDLVRYVEEIPPNAKKIITAFCPGPVTLLLKKKEIIPDIVTSGLDTVGIRFPSHPLTQELLAGLNFPLAAPSANPFGYVSPTSAQHVADQLWGKIPYILDGGLCTIGIESTIIGFEDNRCIIYRLGGIPIEKIENITGETELRLHASSNPAAPGTLESHYAPGKPLFLGDLNELIAQHGISESSVIAFSPDVVTLPHGTDVVYLSPSNNMDEAARNLFSALRLTDKKQSRVILAAPVPDTGLGKAINDRLRRAAVKREN